MKLGRREEWSINGEGSGNSHCLGKQKGDQFGHC